MNKIKKNSKLGEILNKTPELEEVFIELGLPCFICPFAFDETIEQGAKAHGLNPDKIIKILNKELIEIEKTKFK